MQCALYDAGRCRSCQWITQQIPEQLSAKTVDLKNLLADFPVEEWCAPVSGPEQGFRNKAKMVVSGSVEKPLLGMLHRDGTPEDLCDCPLYPASFAPVFAALKPFIARAGLTPYNVARKRGELKYILLTESQSDGGMMLRFVLRSDTKLAQLRKALPWLQEQLPQLKVITVNIKPELIFIATGSEVELAVAAYEKLTAEGVKARVVSMPSTDAFDKQDAAYRESVLPKAVTARVAVEAGIADYWYKYVGLNGAIVGMTTFGESAPAEQLFEEFGFTVDNVVAKAKALL